MEVFEGYYGEKKWIELIMKCECIVQYSILINGHAKDVIIPKRGLSQGDPLSPNPFLLCVEGLTVLINNT